MPRTEVRHLVACDLPPNRDLGLGHQDLTTLCQALTWSSKKEHKADALALGAEEGRDKLR